LSKYIVVSREELEGVLAGQESIVQTGPRTSKVLTLVTDEERKLAKLEARYKAQVAKVKGVVTE
jgi:hypothetical protein